MNKSKLFSWILIVVGIFTIGGVVLYPKWWYEFIFLEGIFSLGYWLDGIRMVSMFLFNNLVFIIIIITSGILLYKKKININLPDINFFSKDHAIYLIIYITLLFILIFSLGERINNEYYFMKQVQGILKKEDSNKNLPKDFIYINEERINNLHDQIKPELLLKEKQTESQHENNLEIGTSENPVIDAKSSAKNTNKEINTYEGTPIPIAKKVTDLISHYKSKTSLNEYTTLKSEQKDVEQLDLFKKISEQYSISFDTKKYTQVYNRVIGENLIKEHSKLKNLNGVIVVKGEFVTNIINDKITLKHNYVEIDNQNRITFIINPIEKNSKISSNSLKDPSLNGQKQNFEVFGKITRTNGVNSITEIFIDAYSIW